MSELISGKEALIALANGQEIEARHKQTGMDWSNAMTLNLFSFHSSLFKFRLKPRTITLNNIEIPAPFEPKEGDKYYHISIQTSLGYGWDEWEDSDYDARASIFGAWRTECEIKQVVSALRSVFKGGV